MKIFTAAVALLLSMVAASSCAEGQGKPAAFGYLLLFLCLLAVLADFLHKR